MKLKPGTLLIAPPSMQDSRFAKTVLLITHNNNSGTFAVCLNRPTKHSAKELSRELELDIELPFTIYWGGPVQQQTVWMVHDKHWQNDTTMYVNENWHVTSHESMFYNLADGDAPRNFRLCFGFCSWMPGQLDMEIEGQAPFNKKSSWLYLEDADPDWIFDTPIDELWEEATNSAANAAIENWF